ncbi:hypothetical protein GF324_07715 [bacterium]|nr:hypothetical protein [bacterium]
MPGRFPVAGLIIVLLLLFMVLPVDLHAKPPKCAVCGERIVGQGFKVDGKHYHPQCFTCAVCGDPLGGKYVKENGTYYHADCYVDRFAPRCDHCGEPIVGNYIEIDGSVYHDTCYKHNFAPICKATGERISGTILQNDWGETIAASNQHLVRDCSACGRFAVLDRSLRLSDDRIICSICRQNAVTREAHGRRLLERTYALLQKQGVEIPVPLNQIELRLVDRDRLDPIAERIGTKDSHGICRYGFESRNNRIVSESYQIYILSYLSEESFISVAAHELFHVWQHAVRADGPSSRILEGGANLAMYAVLDEMEGEYAEYRRDKLFKDPDPVYGDGFRMMHRIYEREGMEGVLRHSIRKNPRPAGQPR